jgi:beta-phosphoglucomutase
MMTTQAIIFDMDGTMVDNMILHHQCWQKALANYGLEMTLEEVMATCHGKNIEIIERLFPGKYTLEERERISFEKESVYRDIFLPRLKLVNGLPALLDAARSAGIPMGIGTAAPAGNVNFVLDNLHIRHYFDAIVDADGVDKGKPEPDVFFKVADMLGVSYANCLVFEDSPTGARTAQNAGMKAIILTTTHQAPEFADIPSVLACVNDYSEVDILFTLHHLNK